MPSALKFLWQEGFFREWRAFSAIKQRITSLDFNPSEQNILLALKRAKFLNRRKINGRYHFAHRYSPDNLSAESLDSIQSVLAVLKRFPQFETEVEDLKLNFHRSGACTAFLLRKILEKLIFLAFAHNGIPDKLKDTNGDFVGLKVMLNLSTSNNVAGTPFLMPKTAKEIDGIKFLGDTSAHNPIANVDMMTIIPVMPFIVTAYEELSKKIVK